MTARTFAGLALAGASGPGWRAAPVRIVSAIAGALALANCSATTQKIGGPTKDPKYGVVASPRVIPEGEAIPKGGGREMVGKPYVVGGRTYVPTQSRYQREGWASWYGTAFHGRLTANGEIFDRDSVAAAHPTLPLPSYVRVTNVLNKRSMIVRVNDRGPYEQSRILDVSERVAEALDFRRKGTARVRIEYVGKASIRGSDDEKLLATLTTDGSPAPFGRGRGQTMLADLREEPAPRLSPAPAVRVAAAPATFPEPTEVDEPAPLETRVASLTADPSSAEAGDDHPAPPRRPVELGGPSVVLAADMVPIAVPPKPLAIVDLLPPQRPLLAGIY